MRKLPPTDAPGQWRKLLEAYALLSDPIARRRYDARCRGGAWGRQIAARLPTRRGSPSQLRLMLWCGLAVSSWAIHHVIARGNQRGKTPPKRHRPPLPVARQNHRGTALVLLEAFVSEARRLMTTEAPPRQLGQEFPALLASYRSAVARHLRDLQAVQLSQPCEADGEREALALMAIWILAERRECRPTQKLSSLEAPGENVARHSPLQGIPSAAELLVNSIVVYPQTRTSQ